MTRSEYVNTQQYKLMTSTIHYISVKEYSVHLYSELLYFIFIWMPNSAYLWLTTIVIYVKQGQHFAVNHISAYGNTPG